MSYSKDIIWEIVPTTIPTVIRNCPKCGNNATYRSSGKFRVNANKNKIDIWLIYQCEECKSTWNMGIYERIAPTDIDSKQYNLFLSNDTKLAKQYEFDIGIHNKNKVKLDFNSVEYEIIGEDIDVIKNNVECKDRIILDIICKYPFGLRVDKVLSRKLGISREKVKKLYEDSIVMGVDNKNLLKQRINSEIRIFIE